MRSLSLSQAARAARVILVAFALGSVIRAEGLRATENQQALQLEVFVNGVPANVIGSFVRLPDNKIAATAAELASIGLRVTVPSSPANIILLDDIPTLKYEYQERSQRLLIRVDDAGRKPQAFDLSASGDRRLPTTQTAWGTVLNYDLFSSTGQQYFHPLWGGGTSLSLDERIFSPYGTFEQSAIAQSIAYGSSHLVRLDTSYRYSDQARMITYGAGDMISGGLAWSRPIRIGGLQAQSNFLLRPDLITSPLLSLGGSAAVPSTVDVYVNSVKTFSQDVGAGPFNIANIPAISGAGNAELVIRDPSGRETKATTPFYASGNLLAPGLTSWSIEGGLPRLSYGSASGAYVGLPVGSATLRGGIFDGFTAEAHGEGGAGVANGGVGAVFRTGTFGVAATAIAASTTSANKGLQTYASYETRLFGVTVFGSSQRTFGSYDDLASATARLQVLTANSLQNINGLFAYIPNTALPASNALAYATGIYSSARAPVVLDRLTVSRQLSFDEKASVSASFIHELDASSNDSRILTVSYSRSMPFGSSVFATVFRDFGTSRNIGVFAGFNMPLWGGASISTGISKAQGGTTGFVEAVKPLGTEPGSYGWRVRDSEGVTPYREAAASYRSNYGTLQVGASQSGPSTMGSMELRGSIVSMDGGVFLSNWIDDGFAVVSTGVAGVHVMNENRPVGVTNADGKLLIPSLRSYQKNKVTIDPTDLPVDFDAPRTKEIVAPADRSGVVVKFDVHSDVNSALVTFVRPDGSFVPAGAGGRIVGGDEFVVGYDGQAFIKNLVAANDAVIEFGGVRCAASFAFTPEPRQQVRISQVPCR